MPPFRASHNELQIEVWSIRQRRDMPTSIRVQLCASQGVGRGDEVRFADHRVEVLWAVDLLVGQEPASYEPIPRSSSPEVGGCKLPGAERDNCAERDERDPVQIACEVGTADEPSNG